ncbi:MAG: hypothetical protein ACK6A7_22170, partial [Planctomycetota bacterium]
LGVNISDRFGLGISNLIKTVSYQLAPPRTTGAWPRAKQRHSCLALSGASNRWTVSRIAPRSSVTTFHYPN